ncbi:MAG: extracellular solute-binding protein [Chloroflexota bacterium]|nr:extracellular solute-binding protein [Chloroflexota bacterium]
MKRYMFTVLAGLIALSLVLTACGPAATEAPTEAPTEPPAEEPTEAPTEEPTEAPAEVTTVTVWHGYAGDYQAPIEALFEEFNTEHEDIQIDYTRVDELRDSLSVAIPAGEGPDIIAWANDQIGRNALTGNIVALDDYIDRAYLEEHYTDPGVSGVIWNDQIWALPETMEGIALVYNKDLVAQDELPAPDDFDALLNKACAFREENPDEWYLCNQGLGNPDAYHVAPIYFGFGMPGYVDDQGKVYLDTPEGIAAGEWMVQFSECAPAETSHEICQAMLAEGQAGIWWTGPWAIASVEEAGIDYGIAPMGKPFVGIKVWMLTSNAVDRGRAEAAVEVMKWWTSADTLKLRVLATKEIPANVAALEDPEVQALYTVSGFGASLERGIPMANTPYMDALWGPVGDATTAIWTGAQTPEEALADAQAAAEETIEEMQ